MGSGSRDVTSYTVVASAARTDLTDVDQVNPGYKGGYFCFNITGATTANAVNLKIQGRMHGTTQYFTVARATASSADAVKTLLLYPGVSTASTLHSEVRSALLPHVWRIASTHSSTGTMTWSASVHLFD